MMLDIGDIALDGHPVGMNIENGHEHRYLYNVAMQILVLIDLFQCHYRAVNT